MRSFLTLFSLLLYAIACVCSGATGLGVNWGTQSSHPLPASVIVRLLKANQIPKVKLFDTTPDVMDALSGSGIQVMLGIPNDQLRLMTSTYEAQSWVQNNVRRWLFQDGVDIRYIAVGNEPFLTAYNGSFLSITLPALQNIQNALNSENLGDRVKATVPLNADVLAPSSLPSEGTFRSDINELMLQVVGFLHQNNCPFTINIYPFISLYNDKHFPVDFAFFNGVGPPLRDGPNAYNNVFDASYDTLAAALMRAGYPNMPIIIGEVGWPTDGDTNANMQYAQRFNQGFLNHVSNNLGTPLRPNTAIDFYLFSLIDEDRKSIAPGNFERHWGIFRFNGVPKYPLALYGSRSGPLASSALVSAEGVEYLQRKWCVLNTNADMSNLGPSMTFACAQTDCTALGYGCSCYRYLDGKGNASYAFNQYYQGSDQDPGSCFFGGLGQLTTQNPSVGTCEFIIQVVSSSSSALNLLSRLLLLACLLIFSSLLKTILH